MFGFLFMHFLVHDIQNILLFFIRKHGKDTIKKTAGCCQSGERRRRSSCVIWVTELQPTGKIQSNYTDTLKITSDEYNAFYFSSLVVVARRPCRELPGEF